VRRPPPRLLSVSLLLLAGLSIPAALGAQQEDAPEPEAPRVEPAQPTPGAPPGLAPAAPAKAETPTPAAPYFLGYESEPAMDAAGRSTASLDRTIGDLLDRIVPRRFPWLRVAWELPVPILLQLVQHEGFGHGARAREFGLHARYGLSLEGAWTDIDESPASNEDLSLIVAGGTEADSVLARRLLLDMYQGRGGPASLVPLLLMAKTDFPIYVGITPKPDASVTPSPDPDDPNPDSFVDQYESGNDIAFWLVTRQAWRRGDGPDAVWEQDYAVDLNDPELRRNWHDLRATAVWAVADPAFLSTLFSYVRDHLMRGQREVHPLRIPLGGGVGMTVSTRAALGPAYVTRFLDILVTTRRGVVTGYLRDLDSSSDRQLGFGLGLQRLELLRSLTLGVEGDFWREPASLEGTTRRDCWNVTLQGDVMVSRRLGVSWTLGAKSAGFFPGRPKGHGVYLGAGALVAF
jgi:hypothetical protein